MGNMRNNGAVAWRKTLWHSSLLFYPESKIAIEGTRSDLKFPLWNAFFRFWVFALRGSEKGAEKDSFFWNVSFVDKLCVWGPFMPKGVFWGSFQNFAAVTDQTWKMHWNVP